MKWYQAQYKGPYWLWAVIVVAIYAGLISLIEYVDSGPAARVSIEERAADQSSPQE